MISVSDHLHFGVILTNQLDSSCMHVCGAVRFGVVWCSVRWDMFGLMPSSIWSIFCIKEKKRCKIKRKRNEIEGSREKNIMYKTKLRNNWRNHFEPHKNVNPIKLRKPVSSMIRIFGYVFFFYWVLSFSLSLFLILRNLW